MSDFLLFMIDTHMDTKNNKAKKKNAIKKNQIFTYINMVLK